MDQRGAQRGQDALSGDVHDSASSTAPPEPPDPPMANSYECNSGATNSGWRQITRSRAQRRLVLFSFAFYVLCLWACSVGENLILYGSLRTADFFPNLLDVTRSPPLPDYALHWLGVSGDAGHKQCGTTLSAFYYASTTFSPLGFVLLALLGDTRGCVVYAWLASIVHGTKTIAGAVTLLPSPNEKCFPDLMASKGDDWFAEKTSSWLWVFFSPAFVDNCNDLLYSGHIGSAALACLCVGRTLHRIFPPAVCAVLQALLATFMFFAMYAMLVCGEHYTVDVVLAIFIMLLLYTHTPLQELAWQAANCLVCNPEHADGQSEVEMSLHRSGWLG